MKCRLKKDHIIIVKPRRIDKKLTKYKIIFNLLHNNTLKIQLIKEEAFHKMIKNKKKYLFSVDNNNDIFKIDNIRDLIEEAIDNIFNKVSSQTSINKDI